MALSGKYEYQSDFAKKHFAQGETKGAHQGRAAMLLRALEHRGLAVDAARRAQIEQASAVTLERWLFRVMDGADLEAIFQDD